jgi:hypothetical protein
MKPNDIQRDVRSGPGGLSRSPGDAPAIGKVARMKGTGMPKGERHQRMKGNRYDRHALARRRTMLVWSGTIIFVSVVALVFVVTTWIRSQGDRRSAATAGAASLYESPTPRAAFPSPSEAEALGLVRRALENRDLGKIADYFRPGYESPEAVISFLEIMAENDGAIDHYEWQRSMDANGMSMEGVLVAFASDGRPRNRLAILAPDEQGVWKIDFPAFARLADPPLEDLIEQRANRGIVRAYVGSDHYYNGPFVDEKTWACYGLATPDSDTLLLGYCKRGSPQFRALESMLSHDVKLARATLDIRRAAGGETRQFEIMRVLAEDWAIGDMPFDERFN